MIIGPAGGEYGIRGFIAAFDAKTGKRSVALQHRSPGPASPATKRGRRARRLEAPAADRSGSPARTIPTST